MEDLVDLRKSIDNIDRAIVALFAERFKVTEKVGLYKKAHNLSAVDKSREDAQFKAIVLKAQEAGLDPEFATEILRKTIDSVVKNHEAIARADS